MSQHALELIQRYYDAFNRRDLAQYERLFTPDCQILAPGVDMTTLEAMRGFDKVWQDALPDGKITNLVMAARDNVVLCSNRITGTHTGPLVTPAGTLPATGRKFDEEYMTKFTLAGERIKIQHLHYDRVRVMEVLGPK
jgi:ketosteroid isomerase-like protein